MIFRSLPVHLWKTTEIKFILLKLRVVNNKISSSVSEMLFESICISGKDFAMVLFFSGIKGVLPY